MHILMAQINTVVGDFIGNTDQVLAAAEEACSQHDAPIVVFPELTLSGYPPEDLLLRPALCKRVSDALDRLCADLPPAAWVIVGYPIRREGVLYNCAGVIHQGELKAEYRKCELPNYQVFDEKRYFTAGSQPCVLEIHGVQVGLSICEDIWVPGPTAASAAAGAKLLINLNASPYHRGKQAQRLALVAERCRANELAVVYVNQVGGQDELVFDGGSFAMSADGSLAVQAPRFESRAVWCEYRGDSRARAFKVSAHADPLSELAPLGRHSCWECAITSTRMVFQVLFLACRVAWIQL
jgi:NAD+ synthase (glutamine-hydrolysing)